MRRRPSRARRGVSWRGPGGGGGGSPRASSTPRAPTPLLTRLVLSLDPKDFVVRQAVLYDQFQNSVTMTFTRVAINGGLSDVLFVFNPPKGGAGVPLEPR